MNTLTKPLEVVTVKTKKGTGEVLRFSAKENYTSSFSYEWSNYSTSQLDSSLDTDLSRSRLELNLGFPLEFLAGKNVIEIGSGPGRFTEHLAHYAKNVVASDLSDAIYYNSALGEKNAILLHCDLWELPKFSEPMDIVFCRGVLQHTKDPRVSLKKLFDLVPEGGLVIFDIYQKTGNEWRNVKYFWRPFFQKFWELESFDSFINRHDEKLYAIHHKILRFINAIKPLRYVLEKTPLYLSKDWDRQYPNLSHAQRIDNFKAELIDMFYSHYDQPMTALEVIHTLASIGQRPYSYDLGRNHFRCKKNKSMEPIKVVLTKNGVLLANKHSPKEVR